MNAPDGAAGRRRVRVSFGPEESTGSDPRDVDATEGTIVARGQDVVLVSTPEGSRRGVIRPLADRSDPRVAGTALEVVIDGWRFVVRVEDAARAALRERAEAGRQRDAGSGPIDVRTPIPGRVVSVSVAVGAEVREGQALLVVEAMKMQNEVRTPRAGTVRRIDVEPGRAVDAGDVLVVIE